MASLNHSSLGVLLLLCLAILNNAQARVMSATGKQQAAGAHVRNGQPVLDQLRAIQKSIDELKATILASPTTKAVTLGSSATFLTPLMTRYDLGAEAERRGYKTGVELGVQTGVFAEHALRTWPSCVTYYLVDIWKTQENYVDGANVPQDRQEQFLADAKQRMQPFAAKAVFLRNFTSAAAPLIPDPVDFVYVDARHDYCGVVEDLTLYWPKVRSGGMMAGHDFIDAAEMNRINEKEHWEVCQDGTKHPGAVRGAVVEFFQRLGLAVHVTYRDGPWNSWMVIKP